MASRRLSKNQKITWTVNHGNEVSKIIKYLQKKINQKQLPEGSKWNIVRFQFLGKSAEIDFGMKMKEIFNRNKKILPPLELKKVLEHEGKVDYFNTEHNIFLLEWFDDFDFDPKTPEKWLAIHDLEGEAFLPRRRVTNFESRTSTVGSCSVVSESSYVNEVKDRARVSVYKKQYEAFLENLFIWTPVKVISYNENKFLWTVQDTRTKKITELPRIYLRFLKEDPNKFVKRINAAINLRDECEIFFKFHFVLDNMILSEYPEPKDVIKNKGLEMNSNVKYHFQYVMAALDLKTLILKNPDNFLGFSVPKNVDKTQIVSISRFEGFQGRRDFFKRFNLFCIPEIIDAMRVVIKECQFVSKKTLFQIDLRRSLTLENFHEAQSTEITKTIRYLKEQWIENTTSRIFLCLRDVGKGWFDITVNKWEIYKLSKLFRFMELVKCRMQSALRDLIENSTRLYCDLLCTPCECTLQCEEGFVWGRNLITSQFQPPQWHVFCLILKMDENRAFYSTDPSEFEPIILRHFDDAMFRTHFVHQIDPLLLQSLIFANNLFLSSVGSMESVIVDRRNYLLLCYRKALIPLKAYATQYKEHIDLFTINSNEFVDNVKESNKSSQEIKEEISFQLKMKENLERTLPASITIGPFFVNVTPLKQFLINKRIELAEKMLKMFAERLRLRTKAIVEQYIAINEKICEKPVSIEHIFEIREFMQEAPEKVRQLEDQMRTTLFDYDILEAFLYCLMDEDFSLKWEAVSWPLKINKQIVDIKESHEEESVKFQKLQCSDEATFGDKIETINVQVSTFSTQYDVNKVTEISIEVKKMWKMVTDLCELGDLLNKRQFLFELQEINLKDLKKLRDNFIPYKTLWTSAADFIKAEETWCGNPLTNIETAAIKNSLQYFKNIFEQLKQDFEELPKIQDVVDIFLERVSNFEPCVEIVERLKHPAWDNVHWVNLAGRSGMKIKYNPAINISNCLEKGILNHKDLVETIFWEAIEDLERTEAAKLEAERLRKQQEELLELRKMRRLRRTEI